MDDSPPLPPVLTCNISVFDQVEGVSMHRKAAVDVTRAMSSVLKKRPKGISSAGQVCVRVVIVTPPWPLPSPSPQQLSSLSSTTALSMTTITMKSEVEERGPEEASSGGSVVGGMACLGREVIFSSFFPKFHVFPASFLFIVLFFKLTRRLVE